MVVVPFQNQYTYCALHYTADPSEESIQQEEPSGVRPAAREALGPQFHRRLGSNGPPNRRRKPLLIIEFRGEPEPPVWVATRDFRGPVAGFGRGRFSTNDN